MEMVGRAALGSLLACTFWLAGCGAQLGRAPPVTLTPARMENRLSEPIAIYSSFCLGPKGDYKPSVQIVVANSGKQAVSLTSGIGCSSERIYYNYAAIRPMIASAPDADVQRPYLQRRRRLPTEGSYGAENEAVISFGTKELAPGQFALFALNIWKAEGRTPDILRLRVSVDWTASDGTNGEAHAEFWFAVPEGY
ncbi:MAG: hypothetical protein FJ288_08760 [Planctomycetes bacterium]|nr:hypothetical protein [Planctomycetota bacterium]